MDEAAGPKTPAGPPRQKRKPGAASRGSGTRHHYGSGGHHREAGSEHRGSHSSRHRSHRSHRHHTPDTSSHMQRRVSFAHVGASRTEGHALSRHASFDPRSGTRHRRDAQAIQSGDTNNAAWAKLVARTQSLEEALASERRADVCSQRALPRKRSISSQRRERRGRSETRWSTCGRMRSSSW